MTAKHTSELWKASGQLIITEQSYPHPNPSAQHSPKIIGEVHWSWEGDRGGREPRISWAEAQFNQRLMIAAPELLAALRFLLNPDNVAICHAKWGDGCNRDEVQSMLEQARAAIAKATGGN